MRLLIAAIIASMKEISIHKYYHVHECKFLKLHSCRTTGYVSIDVIPHSGNSGIVDDLNIFSSRTIIYSETVQNGFKNTYTPIRAVYGGLLINK